MGVATYNNPLSPQNPSIHTSIHPFFINPPPFIHAPPIYPCIHACIHSFICFSIFHSIYPSIHLFINSSSICPSVLTCIQLFLHPSIQLFFYPAVLLFIHPFLHPSTHPFLHFYPCTTRLSIHLSVFLIKNKKKYIRQILLSPGSFRAL